MPYRRLEPERIIQTARTLQVRVDERFPGSGLSKVATELINAGEHSCREAGELAKPIVWLRLLTAGGIAAGGLAFVFIGTFLNFQRIEDGAFNLVQGVEAGINTLLLAGLGLIGLVQLEERFKRTRVLKGLHELRSLIHVIDMHQLTKDPVVFSAGFKPTKSSPQRTLSPADLKRYLDYCSEMLSLTGKFAALYAQSVNDIEVVDAVNDVENLGTNLSRKIWQKIMATGDVAALQTVRHKRRTKAARQTK